MTPEAQTPLQFLGEHLSLTMPEPSESASGFGEVPPAVGVPSSIHLEIGPGKGFWTITGDRATDRMIQDVRAEMGQN